MFRSIGIYMFFQLLFVTVFSQSQDTIVIIDEPVVIHKRVLVEVVQKKPKLDVDLADFYLSTGISYGIYDRLTNEDSLQKNLPPFLVPYLEVGKIINDQWDFGFGISPFFSNINVVYDEKYYQMEEVEKEKYDTISVSIYPSGIRYRIDTTKYKTMENVEYKNRISTVDKIRYWTFPIHLGYNFTNSTGYLQPFVSLNLNFRNRNLFDKTAIEIDMPNTFISGTFGGKLGINLGENLVAELGIMSTKQLSKKDSYLSFNQFQGRVQAKYIF